MTDVADRLVLADANLRDLGGHVTGDGWRVASGRLFRSAHLSELTPDELDTLRSLGLRTIVDLRRTPEVEANPTPDLDGVTNLHLSTSVSDDEFAVMAADLDRSIDQSTSLAQAADYYRGIVTDKLDPYRRAFDAVTDPANHPVLFHCTAGKDRTGFVAATLLRLLGVPEDDVMADYLATNEIRAQWAARILDRRRAALAERHGIEPDAVTEESLESLRVLLIVDARFLQAALDAVPETFGTWVGFRRDGLGVTDDRWEAFAAAVLEPAAS